MNFNLGEGFDKEMKISVGRMLKDKNTGWNTSFCLVCGDNLQNYDSYCQQHKREIKLNQILKDDNKS
jgi:hypothetical protein